MPLVKGALVAGGAAAFCSLIEVGYEMNAIKMIKLEMRKDPLWKNIKMVPSAIGSRGHESIGNSTTLDSP